MPPGTGLLLGADALPPGKASALRWRSHAWVRGGCDSSTFWMVWPSRPRRGLGTGGFVVEAGAGASATCAARPGVSPAAQLRVGGFIGLRPR